MSSMHMEEMSPKWRALFAQHGLSDFASLWDRELEEVQPPNTDRGGISYVYRMTLEGDDGPHVFYVKRQQNYNCLHWRKPWRTHPVCEREWYNSKRLERAQVPGIEPVYYGRRRINGDLQAIFITLGLEGYQDLNGWSKSVQSEAERKQGLIAVGHQIQRMHASNLVHHCLYRNHIYLKPIGNGEVNGEVDVHFIDLEKLRPKWLAPRGIWRDFQALYHKARGWTEQDWQWLIQGYMGESSWSSTCEQFNRKVMRKVGRKR